tara:strand:- start:843 stop:1172 length:330 start_codon:yes stop_codon:yes gene_type:complete
LGQALQLAKRQQVINGVTASMVPISVAAIGLGGVIFVGNVWQKVSGLIPSFDGMLDGISNTIWGNDATKEAILREAAEEAARDGEPLPLWRKALHRFGIMTKFGGGGVY